MTAPTLTYLPDVLEEHLDELGFLWGQRERALRSPVHTLRDLADLEARLEARLQGVLSYGERARPLLADALAGDDPDLVLAAALAALRGGGAADLARVLDAFAAADGDRLDALRRALLAVPAAPVQADLLRLAGGGGPTAAAAAEALAAHAGTAPPEAQLAWFLRDDLPGVRAAGWRIVSCLGLPVDARALAAGARDEDPAVRRAALEAAAWSGHAGLLALGRHLAAAPDPEGLDALHLLAVLGGPDELPHVAAATAADALGPARLALAAAYGHPALMEPVLAALAHPDPEVAAAAGAAFERMTGESVASDRRAAGDAPDAGDDAFEAEFRDDLVLPDPERSRRHWAAERGLHAGALRLRLGHDVARPVPGEIFAILDMESRRELFLRARFHGTWRGSPRELEAYPLAGR